MSGNRRLTEKQLRFVAAYVDPAAGNGNGTVSARLAGYEGNNNVLAVQASTNLRNPQIRKALEDIQQKLLEKAARCLDEGMDATVDRPFLNKHGEIVYSEPRPDHKTRLQSAKLCMALLPTGAMVPTEATAELSSDNPPVQVSEAVSALHPLDRAIIRDAAEIEAELVEPDCNQEDAAHDETGARQK